jgi:pimeloyl-ACP methyl ester carboxylesterase
MKPFLLSLALMLTLLPATPALASPGAPIDQSAWNARKRHVTLPNGVRLAYVEMGDPRGSPVLLLHGYTDSSRVWTMLAPQLGRHRLIIPDQRGHGASDAPACCYSASQLADDARLLLDSLGIERSAVVGHSMGSLVAQAMAADHPERVTRIALVGSTALAPVTRGNWMWDQIMALRTPIAGNDAFLRAWGPQSSPTPVDAELRRWYEPEIAATAPHVWRAVLRELLDVPAARHAADVRAPVLILSGGRDEIFPVEHHRALVAAYPGAEAHVFAELGHNLVLERPHEVGPVLVRFLAAD